MRPADGQSRPGVLNWIHLKPRFPQQSWFCNMAGSRQEAETTWNKIRCGTLCAKTKRKTARAKISSTISTQTLLKPSKTKTYKNPISCKCLKIRRVQTYKYDRRDILCMYVVYVCVWNTYIYILIHQISYNIYIILYMYMCVFPRAAMSETIYIYIYSFSTLRNGLGLRDG